MKKLITQFRNFIKWIILHNEHPLLIDGKFQFTRQLKQDWITALKSGKYIQYQYSLKNPEGCNEYCCLGVLAEIHPHIQLKLNIIKGEARYSDCFVDGIRVGYTPFSDMFEPYPITFINDSSYDDEVRDYSKVILLIENLKTVD